MNDLRLKKNTLGYWEISNKPTPGELQEYYAKKYYQECNGSYELDYSEAELKYFNAKLEQRWGVLKKYFIADDQEKRFLDVGCGEGYALAFFRKLGWGVRGIDFSSAGVQSKNPSCLDALVIGDIFQLLENEIDGNTSYDVIWLQNVLEHVLDPLNLLKLLQKLVAPSGFLVVTVPNDFSITQQTALFKKHIDIPFWVAPPDHLTFFDQSSLKNIANATNWKCEVMLGDFPIDWFLFHPKSNYIRDKLAGKSAHNARVEIENMIHENPLEDVISFWSSAAKLGLGRDITAFLCIAKGENV
jgi:2-polyprenyl-3-methyl-5-hydroxy-6-metoxy-1,4-benzoquinol methylase